MLRDALYDIGESKLNLLHGNVDLKEYCATLEELLLPVSSQI